MKIVPLPLTIKQFSTPPPRSDPAAYETGKLFQKVLWRCSNWRPRPHLATSKLLQGCSDALSHANNANAIDQAENQSTWSRTSLRRDSIFDSTWSKPDRCIISIPLHFSEDSFEVSLLIANFRQSKLIACHAKVFFPNTGPMPSFRESDGSESIKDCCWVWSIYHGKNAKVASKLSGTWPCFHRQTLGRFKPGTQDSLWGSSCENNWKEGWIWNVKDQLRVVWRHNHRRQ